MMFPSWLKWYKKPEYRDIKEYSSAVSSGRRPLSPDGRSKSAIPSQLKLERNTDLSLAVYAGSPMSLYDFYMYLKYIEFSTENLEFYTWFKDYEANYSSNRSIAASTEKDDGFPLIPEKSIASSTEAPETPSLDPDVEVANKTLGRISQLLGAEAVCSSGAPCGRSFQDQIKLFARSHSRFTTAINPISNSHHAVNSNFDDRAELDVIVTMFLTPGADKELNIPPAMRDQALLAIQHSTDPNHLRPIAEHVYQLIRNCSHRNFVRLAVANGTYETLCMATGVGIVLTLAGFLTVMLRAFVPTVGKHPRWDVFASWPMWWVGMSLILSGLRGSCFFLLLFTRRQPLPWERAEMDEAANTKKPSFFRRHLSRIMIFDRKLKVKDANLRKLQHKIVWQNAFILVLSQMSETLGSLVKLSLPLQYQQDIFQELRSEDELVILAQGLGLLNVVTNLLHAYDAAGNNLIIVVGATDRENEWLGEALAEHYAVSKTPMARGLKVINTDKATVSMRQKLYTQGGILSVTSRILIVDLLSKLLDAGTITGMVILHAEKVISISQEAFIVRVYRQFNKAGFLKAFSDTPEPFTTGFAPLANMLRNLFLRKTSLWPRFQVTVAESLEGRKKAEVIELEIPMTDKMREIQNAVLECVEVSIRELKKANPVLDIEDWTVDSALRKNFDIVIQRQLDPNWHRVSAKTRQIISDLTVLKNILHLLLTDDAVSLVKYLDTVVAAHSPPPGYTKQTYSPWLYLEAAHVLLQTARSRVYRGKLDNRPERIGFLPSIPDGLEPVLEEQPKWSVLVDVLNEIERDLYLNPTSTGDSNRTILIMCSDRKACRQIREYLQTMRIKVQSKKNTQEENIITVEDIDTEPSAEFMMRMRLREYLVWKRDFTKVRQSLYGINSKQKQPIAVPGYTSLTVSKKSEKAPPNKRRRVRGGSSSASTTGRAPNSTVQEELDDTTQVSTLLNSALEPAGPEETEQRDTVVDDLENMEEYYELFDMQDLVIIHAYDGDMDGHILEETKPRYIIMYEPDAAFIRRVEVYRSSHSDRSVRVYFMYYGGSVEEQRYLSAVRREKDAFTKLIKEKGSMAMSITHDKSLEDPQEQFLRTVNTRIAGGGRLAATAAPPTVVVDVREFRSPLASLLHGHSMVLVPCQLTIGDYILTPDICVERKSVRDLISSLKNGRLYNQAETMLKHYKNPVLLIEFDQNKSFTFDAFVSSTAPGAFVADNLTSFSAPSFSSGNIINPTNPKSTQHLLVLLTLAFPRLKVIWSSSPHQTAEIFAELKKNSSEPDPIRAVQMGLDFDISSTVGGFPNAESGGMMAAAGFEYRVFNQLPQDMLESVPGTTPHGIESLMLETNNIHEIANMSMEELANVVGKQEAKKIVDFFRRSVFDDERAEEP
ncbi:DNA repair protein RAD16 [Ophidiomyces ophidiicola]|uniref:DNA repair protein RAD16 n=1 Tax=Ophidiomyces ophidiicola TaxID=1387563 RepID=A0ACB8UQL3_9EURO|nr:DNA repair protein RAD16 [Ophidiomyces ophidiicola]KAI2072913.1 DNA repair protein RAD16 [Ophidiomyces ophidiicola]KAI2130882.1 DNA repair protein RAD16 [Ophidiomyces ophidiicola]KAI2165988.1 DNA repair protein RAD16 [Ophidiomyces ophidiicola]KAI2201220.1 DNA repair protein RAD16 [Ophidiomyces ophidiicola]